MKELALAMIVKNESYDIRRCFNSFIGNGINPDIYCIDTGSTDDTIDILNSYGARVKLGNAIYRFDQSRNEVFDFLFEHNIEYKWIMCIDADESLSEDLAANIKNFISNDEYYELYDAAWIHNTSYLNSCYDSKLMIAKADKIKSGQVQYKWWIHEELDRDNLLRERIFDIYGNLYHYSDRPKNDDDAAFIKKHEFYSSIAEGFKNDNENYWYSEYIYALQNEFYFSLINKEKSLKENYDNSIRLLLREYDKGNNPEFRFVQTLLDRYINNYEYTDDWIKLIWKAIENNYITPQLSYMLADLYYKKGDVYSIKRAIHYLEMIDSFEPIYWEDLFGLTDYKRNEMYLENISLWSWEIGDRLKSINTYYKLKDINPKNEYVIENEEFFDSLK